MVAFVVSIESWAVMFLGRVLFGFGGESIAVANSSILADWFEGKEVNIHTPHRLLVVDIMSCLLSLQLLVAFRWLLLSD